MTVSSIYLGEGLGPVMASGTTRAHHLGSGLSPVQASDVRKRIERRASWCEGVAVTQQE
jgi:hypothetical protein